MAITLYRKYRPKTFAEVVGQNHIKTTLMSELESEKLAHAYLFSGPRGLGKTTTARLLSKSVNCTKRKAGQSEPCNSCDSCEEIMSGRSIDVIEIDAASHTGVDNVRENIIENSRFTPSSRKYKVFIIDEVHMLSTSAFNALLKTLEEPPAHAIFILATTEIHKVPETIISRCQHFDFRKVSNAEVMQRLTLIAGQEKKKISKEILENIAYVGQGCLRDAESLLGQVLSLDEKEITDEQAELVLPRARFDLALELVELLHKNDSQGALILVNNLVENGVDLEKFTGDFVELCRKILLVKVSPQLSEFAGIINKDLEKKISVLATEMKAVFLVKTIETMLKRKQELKYSDIAQLPLELGILEIVEQLENSNDNDSGGQVLKKSDEVAVVSEKEENTASGTKQEAVKSEITEAAAQEVKEIADKPQAGFSIKMHQVKSKWPQILQAVKSYNHSLASTLKISKPDKILNSGTLLIYCPNKFLQSRLLDSKNLGILEAALEKVFGTRLKLDIQVDSTLAAISDKDMGENVEEQPKDEANLPKTESLDNLLKAFGGKVVE